MANRAVGDTLAVLIANGREQVKFVEPVTAAAARLGDPSHSRRLPAFTSKMMEQFAEGQQPPRTAAE